MFLCCRIGTFFSPLMPAMGVVKLFLVFYIEKVCGWFFTNADNVKLPGWWISSCYPYDTQILDCSLCVTESYFINLFQLKQGLICS